MKTAFVKKNTEGGAGGLFWEAGEVKELNPYFADELVKLAPGDYEIVPRKELAPEPVAEEPVAEVKTEDVEPEAVSVETPVPAKPKGVAKKSEKTETPSAE